MLRSAAPAALLLLAACNSGGGEGAAPAPAEAAAAPAPAAAPAAPAPAPAPTTPDVAIDAEGLRLVDSAGGAARSLPFGMARPELLAVLERFRGPADTGTNAECGAGPLDYAVWADGLTLHFQSGRFAGWALDRRAEGAHATMSGIGPGATRRALEAAHAAKVEGTSLGPEFTAGGLSGILDGEGPDARITDMWAGVPCVFR